MRRLWSPAWLGGALVAALVAVALLAPLLAPYEPRAVAGDSLRPPSLQHLMGTDDVGADIFSQLLWGSRSFLVVALPAAALTVIVGVAVGATSGLMGGPAQTLALRTVDVFLAIPVLPVLVVIVALSGRTPLAAVVAIGLFGWPVVARTVAAQTLTLRQRGFVAASRGFGGGFPDVLRRHLLPALAPVAVTQFLMTAGSAAILIAVLGFLGLGDPSTVSWGGVLQRALNYPGLYSTAVWTWWVVPAGLAITLAVLGFAFLGVGLEAKLNPRSARRR